VRAVYDLSATPFFLRGSGYAEGTLFPWTVSDFLGELIEELDAQQGKKEDRITFTAGGSKVIQDHGREVVQRRTHAQPLLPSATISRARAGSWRVKPRNAPPSSSVRNSAP
jgi:hypothetical protein